MIITCNKCNTQFSLDDALIKPTGNKVRCNQCDNVFDVYPSEQEASVDKGGEEISGLELEDTIPSEPAAKKVKEETLELESEEIELNFDFEEASEEPKDTGEELVFSEEDLKLELELEPEERSEATAPELKHELGEEELKLELESEEQPKAPELELSDEDFKLELEASEIEPEPALSVETSDEEDMFDLDLDLDSLESKDVEAKESFFEEEIDISEIEKVLDMEEDRAEQEAGVEEVEDMELDLDFDLVEDEAAMESARTPEMAGADEIEPEHKAEAAEEEFDIDLTLEGAPETGPMAGAAIGAKEKKPTQAVEQEAAEAEPIEEAFEAPALKKEKERPAQPFDIGTIAEVEEAEEEPAFVMASEEPETGRGAKPLIFLLVILLLAGLGYGGFTLMKNKGIKIPFISDLLKPSVIDAGNLKIATTDVASRFVDTVQQGRLFVITGKARNDYAEARSAIFITAKLYAPGKVLVRSQSIFCGNVLSDLELASMDVEMIQKRFQNRLGDNNSGARIEPGQEIPFMAVFSDLPDNLEEFTVEVDSSGPVNP